MAKGTVTRGGSNTANWAGGVYSGAYFSQQFYVPYSATNLSPNNNACYVTISNVGVWMYNALAQTDATVKMFYATSAAQANAVFTSTLTLNNTTASLRSGNITETLTSSTSATSTVRYFGYDIQNSGYFNQYTDSTGNGGTGYLAYVNGTRTNGSTGPFKWGSSTTRWETAVELRGSVQYNMLPAAPPTAVYSSATDTSVSILLQAPTDDGYGTSGTAVSSYRVSTNGGTNYTDYGVTAGADLTQSITGLSPNTSYNFQYAARNNVAVLAGAAHSGPYSSVLTSRTKLAAPTTSGSYTATGKVNQLYSSDSIFAQPTGGGANTNYALTYNLESGSLPPNVTLNTSTGTISGTPTTTGTYNFTIKATNSDNGAVTSASQSIVISPSGPKVFNGTTMTSSSVKVYNGSTFVEGSMKIYNGSTWSDPT